MPLTREKKAEEVAVVSGRLHDNTAVYITDYKGLKVEQVNDLRRRFRESGVEYRVVKNTLLRRAMEDIGGYDDVFAHLHGPTAVAFSTEPATAARVIKDFTKDTRLAIPTLKVAYVDGAVFTGDQLDALALLKSRDEIVGDIVGLLLSPINNVIGAVQAPGGTLIAILEAIQDTGE